MKIKSITDVITNSSTEVFLLETDKTLEEVSEILKTITKGYNPPEVMTPDGGPLKEVYDFGSYLFDDTKESDRQEYIYGLLGISYFDWDWYHPDEKMPEKLEEIICLWRNHVWENRKYLDHIISKSFPNHFPLSDDLERCADGIKPWEIEYIPESFLNNFLSKVWAKPLPDFLKIPPRNTLKYWVGKIGFSGKYDNSIPHDTWEEIEKTFGGERFHLG